MNQEFRDSIFIDHSRGNLGGVRRQTMRLRIASFALTLAGLMTAACAASAAVAVHIDETAPVNLAAPVAQLVVVNPSIADVSVIDRRHLLILGRTYGSTQVVALDAAGRRIFESIVNVTPAATGRVSLFRGTELFNYSCADRCERTPMPGESSLIYGQAQQPYNEYPGRAKSAGSGNGGN
jgi:hypothetical protein